MGLRRKRRVHFYRRGFLNRPRHQSIALYLAELDTEHGHTKRGLPWTTMDAGLTLGDCTRTITLEFTASSDSADDNLANVRHKSDVLRELVNAFCDKVNEGLDQVWDGKDEARAWREANPDE